MPLYTILIILHVAAGTLALITGMAALWLKKGSTRHKKAGRYFYFSMWVVCAVAIALHVPRGLFFLPMIAVFSFYLVYSGVRVYKIRRNGNTFADRSIALLASVIGLCMIVWAARSLIVYGNVMGIVMIVFGALCIFFSTKDLVYFIQQKKVKKPESVHLVRMSAAYIAAVTAVLVVNIFKIHWFEMHSWTYPVIWLLPTVVGSFYIAKQLSTR